MSSEGVSTVSFANNFWACDRSALDSLLKHVKKSFDELDSIHTVYQERARLEMEFGEKLMALSDKVSKPLETKDEDAQGVRGALGAMHMELGKTAQSHMDLSCRLKDEVATALSEWLEGQQQAVVKWSAALDTCYVNRQDKIEKLLSARERCQMEYKLNDGKMSPQLRHYESEYHDLLTEVQNIVGEWNARWIDACNDFETMELDRVEFFTKNVWNYANLASARLLAQDEWCETIRKRLEACSGEEELDWCVGQLKMSSEVPTPTDYINHCLKQRRQDQNHTVRGTIRSANKTLPPRPVGGREADTRSGMSTLRERMEQESRNRTNLVKRKPLTNCPMTSPTETFNDTATWRRSTASRGPPPQPDTTTRRQQPSSQNDNGSLENLLKKFEDETTVSGYSDRHSKTSYDHSDAPRPTMRRAEQVPGMTHQHYSDSPSHRHTTRHDGTQRGQPRSSPAVAQEPLHNSPQKPPQTMPSTMTPPASNAMQAPKSPRPSSQQLQQPSPHDTLTQNTAHQYYQQARSMSMPPVQNGAGSRSPMMTHQQPQPQQPSYAPPSPLMLPHAQTSQASVTPGWGLGQAPMSSPSPSAVHAQLPPSSIVATSASTSPYLTHASHSPLARPVSPQQPQYQTTAQYGYTTSPYSYSPGVPPSDAMGRPVSPMMMHSPMLAAQNVTMDSGMAGHLPAGHMWCQAKFDRFADDPMELSFRKGNVFAVSEQRPDGWWIAALWDETNQAFGPSGQIPSNFVDLLPS